MEHHPDDTFFASQDPSPSDAQSLRSFVESTAAAEQLKVETDYGNGFVRLLTSEAQRRQAKQDIRCVEDAVIELLRNSRDAGAHVLFVASSKSGGQRRIVIIDDGQGIPEDMQERIFEPRVTSKLDTMRMDDWGVHGRGMALYSIRENASRSQVLASMMGGGTALLAQFDLAKTAERTDQSTLSPLIRTEDGAWALGAGPHNIARVCCEFGLKQRQDCTVYLGSAVEIAATMYSFGRQFLRRHLVSISADPVTVAPCKRLALSRNAEDFVAIAAGLGLEMSTRSAMRVLQGQITPLNPLLDTLERILPEGGKSKSSKRRRKGSARGDTDSSARGLHISQQDLGQFAADMSHAWRGLARSYYLEEDVIPEVRLTSEGVQVVFPVRRMD